MYIQLHHAQEKGLITEIFFWLAALYNKNKLNYSLGNIFCCVYLTIIRRARIGSESTAHEADGRWPNGLLIQRPWGRICFSKIQVVGQKYRDKTTLATNGL